MAIVTSPKGGMNIEEVEQNKVHKFFFPPSEKIPSDVLEKISKSFELTEDLALSMEDIIKKLYKCFIESDATLIEINPLGVDIEGQLKICDSKVNIDDNANFRQK